MFQKLSRLLIFVIINLFGLFFLMGSVDAAESHISGIVSMNSNITVANGNTLYIDPGTNLTFNNGGPYKIIVQAGGTLVVGGEGAQTILKSIGTSSGDWDGIENYGIVRMTNTHLQNAHYGIDILPNGSAEVSKSTFSGCNFAIRSNQGSVKLYQNSFTANDQAIYLTDNRTGTSQICGNIFTDNDTSSIFLHGTNQVNIRWNEFIEHNINATTIWLDSTTINNQVAISYNNFYHYREPGIYDPNDPENENYFFIIHNDGTPVGVYDCYWTLNGVKYASVSEIYNAYLTGSTRDLNLSNNVTVVSPKLNEVNIVASANDNIPPQLVDLSPENTQPPGNVKLTVIMSDEGWGIDPKNVRIYVNGIEASGYSYIYNHRQYVFSAVISINTVGEYSWNITAKDLAGNDLQDPLNLLSQKIKIANGVIQSLNTGWQNWPIGQFQLITIPLNLSETDHKKVLGFEAPGTVIARWQQGQYVYYGNSTLESMEPGRGFWVKRGEGEVNPPVSISGQLWIPRAQGESDISLQPGWHLIGNPFDNALSFKRISFIYTKPGSTKDEHPFEEAVTDGYVAYGLWGYNGSGYHYERNQMNPWKGYWIRVKKPCDIRYRTTDFSYLSQSVPDWSIQITASQNESLDGANYLGLARTAVAGVDVFDAEKPPAILTGLKSYFLPKGTIQAYGVDYRPATSNREVWEYRVTGLTSGEAKIGWGDLSTIPHSTQLILRDPVTGVEIDLRRSNAYIFNVIGETERKFEIILTAANSSGISISNVRIHQNPFSPLRENMLIYYNLSANATIDLRIYDWVGNLVYVYPSSTVTAGLNREIIWNGRNNLGRMVANGIYFCKITAKMGDFQTSKVVKVAVVN